MLHKNIINTNILFNKVFSDLQNANVKFYIKETRYETFTYVLDVFMDEVKAVGAPILRIELHNDSTLSITTRWGKDSNCNITLSNIQETIENRMFNIADPTVKGIAISCLVLYKQQYDIVKNKTEGLHTYIVRKKIKDIWRERPFNKEPLTREDIIERLQDENEVNNAIVLDQIKNMVGVLRNIKLQVM